MRIPAEVLTRSLEDCFPDAGKHKLRLGRILEPGEPVLLRDPALRWAVVPASLVAFGGYLLLGEVWSLTTGTEVDIGDLVLGLMFALMVYWAIVDMRAHVHWATVVTDHRLLRGLAHDPARYEEFPLSAVEAVPQTTFGDRLFVRLRGEEVRLPAKGETALCIREAIAAAKGVPA